MLKFFNVKFVKNLSGLIMKNDILQEIYKEFKPNTKAEWQEKATIDLKGKALESLNWKLMMLLHKLLIIPLKM